MKQDRHRAKEIAHIKDRSKGSVSLHGVRQVTHPLAWPDYGPDEDRRSKFVFIPHDMPRIASGTVTKPWPTATLGYKSALRDVFRT